MNRQRPKGPKRSRKRAPMPVYEPGIQVVDLDGDRSGTIVDVARQYSHPHADPVHNYLVRWEDGIVEALNERALASNWGIEVEE